MPTHWLGSVLVCSIGLIVAYLAAQRWAAFRSTMALPAEPLTPDSGAFDDLDQLVLRDDLPARRSLLYWCQRLAAHSADEMLVERLPAIVALA